MFKEHVPRQHLEDFQLFEAPTMWTLVVYNPHQYNVGTPQLYESCL